MSWGSVGEFIAMGGYGWYVWGSYDVTFLLIALELTVLVRRHRAARRQAALPSQNRQETSD